MWPEDYVLEIRVNILASYFIDLEREISVFLSWIRVNATAIGCVTGSHQELFGIPG